jgi:catalase
VAGSAGVNTSPANEVASTPTPEVAPPVASGTSLTTNQGLRIADDQNQLRAGIRGPSLLDFAFREKIMHFDHERIPERVVHARGAGAHGTFQLHTSLAAYTKAKILTDTTASTEVFVRFSTVNGSRGSADTTPSMISSPSRPSRCT